MTCRWRGRRAETCRQPNTEFNTYKQLCCDSLISFSLFHPEYQIWLAFRLVCSCYRRTAGNARFQASAAVWTSPALFSDSTQRRLIVSYGRFGTTYRTHHQGSSSETNAARLLKMGSIGCPETSVRNYESTWRKIPKERRTRSSSSIRSYQWRTQEFFSRGSTNSVEDRENGDLGAVAPLVRGSGGSCNLVQEISFHIVKLS